MRKVLAAVTAAALAGGLASAALAAGKTIRVGDNWFVRDGADSPTVRVAKGTRVTFKWVGDAPHNVRAYRGPVRFDSRVRAAGTYKRKFRKAGTYKLVCDIHPKGMRMTLRVR